METVDIRRWRTTTRIVLYVVIPLVVPGTLVAMYFSGVPTLQHIVSPRIPGLFPDSNREFGLLENLQNLCLIAVVATAAAGAVRKKRKMEKAVLAAIAVLSLFVLLEEIDYGLHFYEMARGLKIDRAAPVRNIHNTYDLTDLMKHAALTVAVLLFVLFPIAFTNSSRALRRYIAADRLAIITMVSMFIIRTLAHGLRDHGVGTPGTIDSNLSEFRELTTYYIFVPYLVDLVFRRTRLEAPDESNRAGSSDVIV